MAGQSPIDAKSVSDRSAPEPSSPSLPLVVENLSYLYPSQDSNSTPAGMQDISFSLKPGEFMSVVGPSGCGKSTLLSVVAGLLPGYKGDVRVLGSPVRAPGRNVGVVFQEESTFAWRTAQRNVEFGLQVRGVDAKTRHSKAQQMLDLVGLSGFEEHYPRQLSGGMKQRVAIARTIVTEPALLLMDEPLGALDEQTREKLGGELARIQTLLNQTILFITHSIREAVTLSDQILVLTGHPGRPAEQVHVDLPRPRPENIIVNPRFAEFVDHIWHLIHAEPALNMAGD